VARTVTVTPVNDVPVLADVESHGLVYTENDAPRAVSPSITVSDLDSLTDPVLDSATVTISAGLREGDVLAYSVNSSIAAVFDATSGVLSMVGSVSLESWQSALRVVTFSSSVHDPTGTQSASDRTVSYVISDGDETSIAVTRTVTVTPVNDVPVLSDVESNNLVYTENDAPRAVSPNITVSDLDTLTDPVLDTATVSISTGMRTGDMLLYSVNGSNITAAFSADTGVMSMSGSVSVPAWQAALRDVTFSSSEEDPTGTQLASVRTITFVISDGDSTSSVVTRSVTVVPVNDVPMLAGMETGALAYTENDGATLVSVLVTVSDADWLTDPVLDSATVTIADGMHVGDVLACTADASEGVTASFDVSTGALTMTGSVSLSVWQEALRMVTYSSSSEDPTGTHRSSSRTVAFVISDGDASSVAVNRTIVVNPIVDPPVLDGLESSVLSYTENQAATHVSPMVTVSDADYIIDVNLESATAVISSGLRDGDILDANTTDTGISATYDGSSGALSLSGSVPVATWQMVLRSITYSSTSDDPTGTQQASSRVVSFAINDGNLSSAVLSRVVTVAPVNDVPELLNAENASLHYVELSDPLAITSSMLVFDADFITDAHLDSATVAISAGTLRRGDYLAYLPRNVTDESVSYGSYGSFGATAEPNLISAVWNPTSGVLSLSGSATQMEWQTALRSVKYWSTSGDPTGYGGSLDKIMAFMISDGDSISIETTRTIYVTPINNAPVLSGWQGVSPMLYTENDPATVVFSAISVSDADVPIEDIAIDSQLDSATVTISSGFRMGDVLTYPESGTGITAVYNLSTGAMFLSGQVSISVWQAALRSVTYSSTEEDPTGTQVPADRTVSFVITDGEEVSQNAWRTVTVTPVNDVPVLTGVVGGLPTLLFAENDPPATVYGMLAVSDLDWITDWSLPTAIVSISDGLTSGDQLAIGDAGEGSGVTATFDEITGVLSMTGDGVSQAMWQQTLQAVVFESSLDIEGGGAYRNISFQISDGNAHSNVVRRAVKVESLAGNFSFSSYTLSRGENEANATFCVVRTGAYTGAVVVTLSLATFTNVTSATDASSLLSSTALSFAHKQRSSCADIAIIDDVVFQQHPLMYTATIDSAVSTSGGDALLIQPRACTLTVRDDGDAGTFGFEKLHHRTNETIDGTTIALKVLRSAAQTSGVVQLNYAVNEDSATSSDIRNGTGSVTFNDGDTEKEIVVVVYDDKIFDPEERFWVTLTNTVVTSCDGGPDGAQCLGRINNASATALVTIWDDGDQMPPLRPPAPVLWGPTGGSMNIQGYPSANIGGYSDQVQITDYRVTMLSLFNGSYLTQILRESSVAQDWDGPYLLRLAFLRYEVVGLTQNTNYTFSVAARNDGRNRNYSVDSPAATASTLMMTPSTPPTNMTVVEATGGSVTLHWTMPFNLGGTPAKQYVMYVCDEFPDRASCDSGSFQDQAECPPDKIMPVRFPAGGGAARYGTVYHVQEKMHYDCPYRVRMVAVTDAGYGAPSEWLLAPTGVDPTTPEPPTDVRTTTEVGGVVHTGGQLNVIVSRPLDEGGRSIDGFHLDVLQFGTMIGGTAMPETETTSMPPRADAAWARCYSGPGKDLNALVRRWPKLDLDRAHDTTDDPFCAASDIPCTRSLFSEECSLLQTTMYAVRVRVFRTAVDGSTVLGDWFMQTGVMTTAPTTPGRPLIYPPVHQTGGSVRLSIRPPNDFGGVQIQKYNLFIYNYYAGPGYVLNGSYTFNRINGTWTNGTNSTWGTFCASGGAACEYGEACQVGMVSTFSRTSLTNASNLESVAEAPIVLQPTMATRYNSTLEVYQLRANFRYRFVATARNLISTYQDTQSGCDCDPNASQPLPAFSAHVDVMMPDVTDPLPVRDVVQMDLWADGVTPMFGANATIGWTAPLDLGGANGVTSYRVQLAGVTGDCGFTYIPLPHYAFPRAPENILPPWGNCSAQQLQAQFNFLCAHQEYNVSVVALTVGSDGNPRESAERVLTIKTGMPRPPSQPLSAPSIEDTGSSTMNVSWDSPLDVGGSHITGYNAYYTPLSAANGDGPLNAAAVSGFQTVTLTSTKDRTHVKLLTGLVANTLYSVRIAAINVAGVGDVSEATVNATGAAAAPADPAPPQIMAASGGGVALQLPAPADTGGVPASDIVYQVVIDGILTLCVQSDGKQYKPPNNGNSGCKVQDTSTLTFLNRRRLLSVADSLTDSVPGVNDITWAPASHRRRLSGTGVTLGGLLSSSTYSLVLRVENSQGVSPPTEPQALETTAPTAPSAPETPTELAATTDSYQIAWKVPPDTGGSPVTGFNVYQSNSSSGVFSLLCPACISSVATIDYIHLNLEPSQQYYYKVAALNSVGESPSSTVLAGSTNAISGPSPPQAVLLSMRSASSVTVTWIAPLSFGGYPFSHYQIAIHVGHSSGYDTYPGSDLGWVISTTPNLLVGTATDLLTDTEYSVRVRAASTQLNGFWSEPYDVRTQRTGTVVDAPTAGCITSTTVDIAWALPSINTSIIEVPGFKVQVWRAATTSSARVLLETNDVVNATQFEMTGLDASTQYEFAVGTVVKDIATSVVTQPTIFSSPLTTSTTANAQVSTCHGATGSFDSANAAGVGYAASETRSWTIMPTGASAASYTVITFTRFNLECDHDSVTIYGLNEAGDINSTIWSGGCSRPGISTFRIGAAFCDFVSCSADSVKSHIRGVKVVLTSDGHVQEGDSATTGGFALEYATDMPIALIGRSIGIQCPATSSNMNGAVCSNRGTCAAAVRIGTVMQSSGSCECSSGFASEDCSNIDCSATYLAFTTNTYRKYVCGFSASSSAGASATQVSVAIAPFGSDTAGTGSASNDGKSPKPYKTLTSALATATASASSGQSIAILLYPGTYSGDDNCGLTFTSGNVQLVSVSAAGGVPETILDCASWQNGRRLTASKPILAVEAGSTAVISGVHFKGGSAGGVSVTGGNASFDRCYFTDNTHTLGAGITATAGAVVSLSNSLIQGNNASTDGGGVYIDDSTTLSLSATAISGNAASRGAGVFVGSGSSLVGSSASAITDNTAGSDGGGVFVAGSGIVTGLSVASNNAVRGGGLFWHANFSAAVSLESVAVSSNTASTNGGGVFVFSPSDALAQLTTKDTAITENTAANSGGGLYIAGATVATGSDSTVLSLNSAGANGGGAALYNMSGDSQFTAFSMVADTAKRGGGLYVSGGTAAMQNLWISGCDATCSGSSACVAYGGGVFMDAGTWTAASNCTADNNRATAGAGMFVADTSAVTFLNTAAATFAWRSTGNTAEHGGGLLLHGAASVTKLVVEGNTATGGGGGAFVAGAGESTCADCTVRSNHAAEGGGIDVNGSWVAVSGAISAVSVSSASTAAYLQDTVVSENTAVSGGGAYVTGIALLRGMTTTGLGALLSSNAATQAGGAVVCGGGATVRSLRLTNSSAGNGTGGGVFVAAGGSSGRFSCTLELAVVANSTATEGGSSFVSEGASLRLASSTMNMGVATRGGNLFVDTSATVTHTNSTLSHGEATSGGSVYLRHGLFVELGGVGGAGGNGSKLAFGSASHAGGNLFVEGSSQASGLLVARGTAPVGGGAMVASGSVSTFSSSVFEFNTATCTNTSAVPSLGCGGGGIATGGALESVVALQLDQVAIRSNSASKHGGGLLLYNTNIVHSGTTITDNTASLGGGISVCNTDTDYAVIQPNGCSANMTASSASSSASVSSTGVVTASTASTHVLQLTPTSVLSRNTAVVNGTPTLGPNIFVSSGARLSIVHMRVSGGTTLNGGGLFLAKASVAEAAYCVFDANTAVGPFVKTSQLKTVTSIAVPPMAAGGAAFVSAASRLVLNASYLTNNTATSAGGAVALAPTAELVTSGSAFENNKAAEGGAVYMSISSQWSGSGDRATDNIATENGGAVFVQEASVTMLNASLVGNRVVTVNGKYVHGLTGMGGAIYQYRGASAVSKSTLSGGIVPTGVHARSGGMIYAMAGTLEIKGSTVSGGKAQFGGAVALETDVVATVTDSAVTGNTASELGGGLHLDERCTVTLLRSSVANNLCSFDGGGAFVDGASSIICDRCDVSANSADDRGGGVFLSTGDNSLASSFGSFTGNLAARYGGAVCATRKTMFTDVHSTFTSNGNPGNATTAGGAVYVTDTTVRFNGSAFISNRANDGGAVFLERKSTGYFSLVRLALNLAARHGGAVAIDGDAVSNVEHSSFVENHALGGGGVHVAVRGVVAITNTSASLNHASEFSTTLGLEADGGGFLLCAANSRCAVTNSQFANNFANSNGGALAAIDRATLTVTGASFSQNAASLRGGGVFVSHTAGVELHLLTFDADYAIMGPAVFWHYVPSLSVLACSECRFTNLACMTDSQYGDICPRLNGSVHGLGTNAAGLELGWFPITTVMSGQPIERTPDSLSGLSHAENVKWLPKFDATVSAVLATANRTMLAAASAGIAISRITALNSSLLPFMSAPYVMTVDYYHSRDWLDDSTECSLADISADSAMDPLGITPMSAAAAKGAVSFPQLTVTGAIKSTPYTVQAKCTSTTIATQNSTRATNIDIGGCTTGFEMLAGTTVCTRCPNSTYSLHGAKCLECPRGANCSAMFAVPMSAAAAAISAAIPNAPIATKAYGVTWPTTLPGYYMDTVRVSDRDQCYSKSAPCDQQALNLDISMYPNGIPSATASSRIYQCQHQHLGKLVQIWDEDELFECLTGFSFYKCRVSAACTGGVGWNTPRHVGCATGYEGVKCSVCSPGYLSRLNGECHLCDVNTTVVTYFNITNSTDGSITIGSTVSGGPDRLSSTTWTLIGVFSVIAFLALVAITAEIFIIGNSQNEALLHHHLCVGSGVLPPRSKSAAATAVDVQSTSEEGWVVVGSGGPVKRGWARVRRAASAAKARWAGRVISMLPFGGHVFHANTIPHSEYLQAAEALDERTNNFFENRKAMEGHIGDCQKALYDVGGSDDIARVDQAVRVLKAAKDDLNSMVLKWSMEKENLVAQLGVTRRLARPCPTAPFGVEIMGPQDVGDRISALLSWLIQPEKFKLILGFGQVLSSVRASFDIPWPRIVDNNMQGFSWMNLEVVGMFSLDCLGTIHFYDKLHYYLLVLPLILLLVFAVYRIGHHRYSHMLVDIPRRCIVSGQAVREEHDFLADDEGEVLGRKGSMFNEAKLRDARMQYMRPDGRRRGGQPEVTVLDTLASEGNVRAAGDEPMALQGAEIAAGMKMRELGIPNDKHKPRSLPSTGGRVKHPVAGPAWGWGSLKRARADVVQITAEMGEAEVFAYNAERSAAEARAVQLGQERDDSIVQWLITSALPSYSATFDRNGAELIRYLPGMLASLKDVQALDTTSTKVLLRSAMTLNNVEILGVQLEMKPADVKRLQYAVAELRLNFQEDLLSTRIRYNLRVWRARSKIRMNFGLFKDKVYRLLFGILVGVYTPIGSIVIATFPCEEVGEHSYLRADMRLQCWDDEHLANVALGLLGVLVFVLGIPYFFYRSVSKARYNMVQERIEYLFPSPGSMPQSKIWERQGKLAVVMGKVRRRWEKDGDFWTPFTGSAEDQTEDMKKRVSHYFMIMNLEHFHTAAQIGFIVNDYKLDFWWYELVECVRKILLIGGVLFLSEQPDLQILLATVLCFIFTCIVLVLKPYKEVTSHQMAVGALGQLTLILYLGYILSVTVGVRDKEDFVSGLALFIVISNWVLLLWFGYTWGYDVYLTREDQIQGDHDKRDLALTKKATRKWHTMVAASHFRMMDLVRVTEGFRRHLYQAQQRRLLLGPAAVSPVQRGNQLLLPPAQEPGSAGLPRLAIRDGHSVPPAPSPDTRPVPHSALFVEENARVILRGRRLRSKKLADERVFQESFGRTTVERRLLRINGENAADADIPTANSEFAEFQVADAEDLIFFDGPIPPVGRSCMNKQRKVYMVVPETPAQPTKTRARIRSAPYILPIEQAVARRSVPNVLNPPQPANPTKTAVAHEGPRSRALPPSEPPMSAPAPPSDVPMVGRHPAGSNRLSVPMFFDEGSEASTPEAVQEQQPELQRPGTAPSIEDAPPNRRASAQLPGALGRPQTVIEVFDCDGSDEDEAMPDEAPAVVAGRRLAPAVLGLRKSSITEVDAALAPVLRSPATSPQTAQGNMPANPTQTSTRDVDSTLQPSQRPTSRPSVQNAQPITTQQGAGLRVIQVLDCDDDADADEYITEI
jgi:hypothetical protein